MKPEHVIESTEMKHAMYNREPLLTHTVLNVLLSGRTAQYLTLLYPQRKGTLLPDIYEALVSNGKGIRISFANTVSYGCIRPK